MSSEDLIALIRERRSVREFTRAPVDPTLVAQIVECGLSAPSSKNSNPWFIVTVSGLEKTRLVEWLRAAATSPAGTTERSPVDPRTGAPREGLRDTVDESIATMDQADTLILLLNRGPFSRGADELLKLMDDPEARLRGGRALYAYAGELIGLGAAAENMLLAARALGLGAVYMADAYPARRMVMEALKTTKELVGIIALGYAAYEAAPRPLRTEFAAEWKEAIGRIDSSVSERESFWVSNV